MSGKTAHKEVNRCEMRDLIERVEHAIEHDLALSTDDLKLLLAGIQTLLELHDRLEEDDTTLHKLRKLLGMVRLSESRSKGPGQGRTGKGKRDTQKKERKPRTKKAARVTHHKLTKVKKGDRCPHCSRGTLGKYKPGELLRITGHAPYEATKHITEQLRCNGCLEVVSAALPEEVLADGHAEQKYGYSARSLMAINKFFTGTPYNHQSTFSDMMGCSISASTAYDQCRYVANDVQPVVDELKRQAGNAELFDVDDTRHRILSQKPELREKRNGSGTRLRSGVYTSGLVATLCTGQEIVLYDTSLGHAGEHLDSILDYRASEVTPLPIVMSDALSSNTSRHNVIAAYCNAHCRRNFFDLEEKHPQAIDYVLGQYGEVWANEALTKEKDMSAAERLAYHKENSLPVMEELKRWALAQSDSEEFEEHSAFGKAIKYLIRHYNKLIQFCVTEKAKIDNNRMEERLKLVIRSRKSSHFHKTQNGADVANTLTSLIATADLAGINIFDYLRDLQRYRVEVRENPVGWLPWHYEETMATKQAKLQPDKAA